MAGFGVDNYCRIFSFEENKSGRSGKISLYVSQKNPQSDEYELKFRSLCTRVAGTALNQLRGRTIPENGLPARIKACEVQGTGWDNIKKCPGDYWFTVFAFAFEGEDGYENTRNRSRQSDRTPAPRKKQYKPAEELDGSDLPF